jgi:hypothetical protein
LNVWPANLKIVVVRRADADIWYFGHNQQHSADS